MTLAHARAPGAATQAFLAELQPLYVDGGAYRPRTPAETVALNPADGLPLGRYTSGTAADALAGVEAARRAFAERRWTGLTPSSRAKILWRIGELIERDAVEFAELETLDAGKLLAAALHGDVVIAAEAFRYHSGWCTKLNGEAPAPTLAVPGEYLCYTRHEPVGVAALIVPWNGPLAMACWKLAPALAAGCSVVIKPPEQASLSVLRLARVLAEAGVPPGVVNIVTGPGASVGQALIEHPGVDKVSFTGSTATGRRIVTAAAATLKRVTLELGGKSAAIVFADADLERAAAGVAAGIFGNAGQVCVASSRLFVEASIYDEFIARVVEHAQRLRVGPGMDPESQMGPVISADHLASIEAKVARGCSEGARCATGGRRLPGDGFFYAPTVLVDVPAGASVMREEIFGPVLCAAPVASEAEAIAAANDTLYPLAGSVWTGDLSRAHRVAAAVGAGLFWVNDHGRPDVAIPFGGLRLSGWGREHGRQSVESYTETKSVMVRL
jgi:phenylacetaldehyde dehydrogenase